MNSTTDRTNWGNNPMGLIMENSNPGTLDEYLTPPEEEVEAEGNTSGAEADTEEVENPLWTSLTVPWKRPRDTL